MRWLRFVGSLKLWVSFEKELYKTDHMETFFNVILLTHERNGVAKNVCIHIICDYRSLLQKSPVKETICVCMYTYRMYIHM